MRNNIFPLLIGLIVAAAAIFMLRNYLESQRKDVLKQAHETVISVQENQTVIYVARQAIPAGVPISTGLVDTMVVLRHQAPPDCIKFLSELDGKATDRALSPGEPITTTSLRVISFDPEEARKQLSKLIPRGKRAVAVNPENIASLIQMLKPADHVDVIAIIALPVGPNQKEPINVTIFQDILVLAVGDDYGSLETAAGAMGSSIKKLLKQQEDPKAKKDTNPPITLALSPEEANVISFVQDLTRNLRNILDSGWQETAKKEEFIKGVKQQLQMLLLRDYKDKVVVDDFPKLMNRLVDIIVKNF